MKLNAGATTTVVNHPSVGPNSHISLTPVTAHALLATQTLTVGGGVLTPGVLTAYAPKIITATRVMSLASGNVGYTGVGFKPSVIQFLAGGPAGTNLGYVSQGYDDGTAHFCTAQLGGYTGGSTVANFQTSYSILMGDNAGGSSYQYASVYSMDPDGFTLAWTKSGTPTATGNFVALCFPPAPTITNPTITAPSATANGVYVSAKSLGSFTITHPSSANADQIFTYEITGGA